MAPTKKPQDGTHFTPAEIKDAVHDALQRLTADSNDLGALDKSKVHGDFNDLDKLLTGKAGEKQKAAESVFSKDVHEALDKLYRDSNDLGAVTRTDINNDFNKLDASLKKAHSHTDPKMEKVLSELGLPPIKSAHHEKEAKLSEVTSQLGLPNLKTGGKGTIDIG